MTSVSYTHLDVYKRQALAPFDRAPLWCGVYRLIDDSQRDRRRGRNIHAVGDPVAEASRAAGTVARVHNETLPLSLIHI